MSGFSNEFIAATRAKDTKALDQQISGASAAKYLTDGEHEVRIAVVDRTKLPENKLGLKFISDDGKEHNETVFVSDRNRQTGKVEQSWKFSKMVAACLPNRDALEALDQEIMAANADVLDLLIGMRVKVTLKRGKGYGPAVLQPDGTYHVKCTVTDDIAGSGNTIEEARLIAEQHGYKRAYLNVDRFGVCDSETNVLKFTAGLVAMREPKQKSPFPFNKVAGGGTPF